LSIYAHHLKYFLIQEGDDVVGGFYLMPGAKWGFNYYRLPPYTPNCGFFTRIENKNTAVFQSKQKQIIDAFAGFCADAKVGLIMLAMPTGVTDLQPFIWRDFKVVPNYTYTIELSQSIETIVQGFDPKHRNMVNKAMREQVMVTDQVQNDINLFNYFATHLKAAGANVYEKELNNLLNVFSKTANSFTLTASKDDKVVGRVICAYDSHTCYYLLGATEREPQGVNNLLVLRAIEKAKALGCAVFDFEGSMLPGVEKFFRGFGGNMHPFFTFNKASLPAEFLLKFRKRHIF
jgi:lipid II:glycine glycyltransferase (peptidoglycan interpeptide bridge formation enzyme)